MKLVALAMVVGLVGCKKESLCEKAANKMLDCKRIVGGLTNGRDLWVTGYDRSQAKQTLVGACDAATDASESSKKQMQCVVDADGCDFSACE